jgi:hypothetical protein
MLMRLGLGLGKPNAYSSAVGESMLRSVSVPNILCAFERGWVDVLDDFEVVDS